MADTPQGTGKHSIADWLAQPEDRRLELIDGELIEKAAPGLRHGLAQGSTWGVIGTAYGRRTRGPEAPGGWWIATEVDVELNGQGFRPDLLRRYHQAGVPHYWILDQVDQTLTVHRHAAEGYLVVLRAEAHERVRAEPFDAISPQVAELLGEEPERAPA